LREWKAGEGKPSNGHFEKQILVHVLQVVKQLMKLFQSKYAVESREEKDLLKLN
jgi:hypothetical protein